MPLTCPLREALSSHAAVSTYPPTKRLHSAAFVVQLVQMNVSGARSLAMVQTGNEG